MKKLNICKLIDQFGWAYFFVTKEQQKYSRYNIYPLKLKDALEQFEINSTNILYISSPDMGYNTIMYSIIEKCKKANIKVITAYASQKIIKYNYSNLVVSISLPFTKELVKLYPDKTVIFLPESIDSGFFSPKKDINSNSFIVGYAGSTYPVKRTHLLDKLNYPVVKQCQHGTNFFIAERTLEPMLRFYYSIDTLILLSKSECMPRVVLEAMACGLPVIATNVGSLNSILDKEWLINSTNEKEIIEEANYKLNLLEKSSDLRNKVGKRNRKYIEEYFSWKKNQRLWDNVFESLYKNNYENIKNISNGYLQNLKKKENCE